MYNDDKNESFKLMNEFEPIDNREVLLDSKALL
jgi:hypothetical protein